MLYSASCRRMSTSPLMRKKQPLETGPARDGSTNVGLGPLQAAAGPLVLIYLFEKWTVVPARNETLLVLWHDTLWQQIYSMVLLKIKTIRNQIKTIKNQIKALQICSHQLHHCFDYWRRLSLLICCRRWWAGGDNSEHVLPFSRSESPELCREGYQLIKQWE